MNTCATCNFWKEKQGGHGECRKRPPTVISLANKGAAWPDTAAADWCGEHSANKTSANVVATKGKGKA